MWYLKKAFLLLVAVLALVLVLVLVQVVINANSQTKRVVDAKPQRVGDSNSGPFSSCLFNIDTGGDQGCPFLSPCMEAGLELLIDHDKHLYKMTIASCKSLGHDGEVADCDGVSYRVGKSETGFTIYRGNEVQRILKADDF